MKTAINCLNFAIALAFAVVSVVVGFQLVRAVVSYYFGSR
jgi:hypothetical protein